jgi:superfamily II DNA or RNA helicase
MIMLYAATKKEMTCIANFCKNRKVLFVFLHLRPDEHLKGIKEAVAQAHGPDVAVITGETSEKDKQTILLRFQRTKGLLLMTFRSLASIDLPGIHRLFILTPVKNGDYISHAAGALIAGNANNEPGVIYDYRDVRVSVLDSSYQKRRKLYGSMGVILNKTT